MLVTFTNEMLREGIVDFSFAKYQAYIRDGCCKLKKYFIFRGIKNKKGLRGFVIRRTYVKGYLSIKCF